MVPRAHRRIANRRANLGQLDVMTRTLPPPGIANPPAPIRIGAKQGKKMLKRCQKASSGLSLEAGPEKTEMTETAV